jgi:uncharacterized protein YdaU (DUF1376 family)
MREKKEDKRRPWFPFYASEFLAETSTYSNEEVGAYILLLATQWQNRVLPSELSRLALICRLDMEGFMKIWHVIKDKFHTTINGTHINRRLENVRVSQVNFSESQSLKGTKRWQRQVEKNKKIMNWLDEKQTARKAGLNKTFTEMMVAYEAELAAEMKISVEQKRAIVQLITSQLNEEVRQEKKALRKDTRKPPPRKKGVPAPPKVEETYTPVSPEEEPVVVLREEDIIPAPEPPPEPIPEPPVVEKTLDEKIDEVASLHNKMVMVYFNFLSNVIQVPTPKQLPNAEANYRALKQVREYLLKTCDGDEKRVLAAWKLILDNERWHSMPDWLQRGFYLTDIFRNILRIIEHHKRNVREPVTQPAGNQRSYNAEAVNAMLELNRPSEPSKGGNPAAHDGATEVQ